MNTVRLSVLHAAIGSLLFHCYFILYPFIFTIHHILATTSGNTIPNVCLSLHYAVNGPLVFHSLSLSWHSWRVRLAKQETLTPPGHLVSSLVCRGPWMSTVVLYCWCHSDSASVLLYFILYVTFLKISVYRKPRKIFWIVLILAFGTGKYNISVIPTNLWTNILVYLPQSNEIST